MGYYDYQQGLIVNHLKQGDGWHNHEKRCREFILKAADYYSPEKITVLGSGWLLDVPLAELADRTAQICLFDIVHPPEVRDQVGRFKNVELSEQDITGGLIDNVWRSAGKRTFLNKIRSLAEIEIPEFKLENPGMVISLNILTQLESMPLRLLGKKARIVESDLFNFRKKIQESHLNFLTRHKSLLITDTAEIFTDSSGKISEVRTAIADLPKGRMKETWRWDFDLKGSDFNMKRSVMEVSAIIL
jgi:hypothetical protein